MLRCRRCENTTLPVSINSISWSDETQALLTARPLTRAMQYRLSSSPYAVSFCSLRATASMDRPTHCRMWCHSLYPLSPFPHRSSAENNYRRSIVIFVHCRPAALFRKLEMEKDGLPCRSVETEQQMTDRCNETYPQSGLMLQVTPSYVASVSIVSRYDRRMQLFNIKTDR